MQGVLARSPEPEARDKVLDNNPDQIGNLEMLVFVFYLSTKTITASIEQVSICSSWLSVDLLSVFQSVCLSIYVFFCVCVSVSMHVYLFVFLKADGRSFGLSVCPSNERPTCLLSVCLSIELSISLLVCLSIYVYLFACLTAVGRSCSGFCPRVPVHKSRYKGPNNTQQLTNDLLNKERTMLIPLWTRTPGQNHAVSVNQAASVPAACLIFNL